MYVPVCTPFHIPFPQEIADVYGDKTLAQIAINWCMCKGVIPIPGASMCMLWCLPSPPHTMFTLVPYTLFHHLLMYTYPHEPHTGAKNKEQVADIAGALNWRLTADQVQALDDVSAKISVGLGAPFENW